MSRVISTLLLSLSLSQGSLFEAAVTGAWSGTLEYRDYRSDKRVILPTKLVVSAVSPGVLAFAYVYDDGPGKTVTENDRVTIDVAKSTYRVQNGDGTYDGIFAAAGLTTFGAGSETITLTGKGDENGVVVDLKTTIHLAPKGLTILRESRKAGEDWLFRNRYLLTR